MAIHSLTVEFQSFEWREIFSLVGMQVCAMCKMNVIKAQNKYETSSEANGEHVTIEITVLCDCVAARCGIPSVKFSKRFTFQALSTKTKKNVEQSIRTKVNLSCNFMTHSSGSTFFRFFSSPSDYE